MSQVKELLNIIKSFLLRLMGKDFLIFLFFLILSGFFWLITSLNQTVEKEVAVPIQITNLPENVVITSTTTDTLRVTLRDKGYLLSAYAFGNKLHAISVNFQNYSKDNGHGLIASADLQRLLHQQLYSSTRIVAMKPDKMEFYYNYGANKKVPVRFQGKVLTGENYFLANTRIVPDSVTIYAASDLLGQIRFVSIEPLEMQDVTDTVRTTVRIEKQTGVKCGPNTVRVELYPDVLTQKKIEVNIEHINMPEGKVLRTFPSKAVVHCVVGARQYRNITAEGFRVVVNYDEIEGSPSDKCQLHLVATPNGVSNAKLEFSQVDYLVEQQ